MVALTQQEINALYQSHKNILVRVDLYQFFPQLNATDKFMKIDEVTGVVIDGSIQEDADADIRRTANLELFVTDSSFVLSSEVKVWLDKYLAIYLGYESQETKETFMYPMGFFTINETDYSYSPDDKTLRLALADLVTTLDGSHSGALYGAQTVKLEADELSIRAAMRHVVQDQGHWPFTEIDEIGPYQRESIDNRIPYTIELETGTTVWDVVKELRDLYPGYECFFDIDGIFKCQRIPTCLHEPIMMTTEMLAPLVVAERSNTTDLAQVKNVIEVYGKNYDEVDFFTDDVTGTGGLYKAKFESFTKNAIDDDTIFSFEPNHWNPGACQLQVNNLTPVDIMMSVPNVPDKQIPEGLIQAEMPIVVIYEKDPLSNTRRFRYVGRTTVHAIKVLTGVQPRWMNGEIEMKQNILKYNCHNISYAVNPDSPFTVEKVGERVMVCSGEEYDLIEDDITAMQRAEYELWKATNMQSTLTLETMLIPWLQVNQKICYESPLDKLERQEQGMKVDTDEDCQYIIKRIDRSLSNGTMTMDLVRFYNEYPWIISTAKTVPNEGEVI